MWDLPEGLRCFFLSQTCQKQYKSATEMETHLSSYDHHHKKASPACLHERLTNKGLYCVDSFDP